MPSISNFTLSDRKDTPEVHTFSPHGRDSGTGVTTWVETDGSPIGDVKITSSTRKTQSGAYKVTVMFHKPVVGEETVDGITRQVVLRQIYGKLEITYPADSTTAERDDYIGMFSDIFSKNKAIWDSQLVDLESVW